MKPRRYAHAIFCDDVRHEVGNKLSFIGVYSGNIQLPGPTPGILPKFCVAVWWAVPIAEPAELVKVIISGPPLGSEPVVTQFTKPDPDLVESSTDNPQTILATFVQNFSPFRIEAEGVIDVVVSIDGIDFLAGRLTVVSAPQVSGDDSPAL